MQRRTRWMAAVASATLLVPNVASSLPPANASATPPLHAARLSGPTLSLGDQGEDVKTVQRRLRLPADGRFGPRTKRAVQQLQAAAGLVADGIVGPLTWAALSQALPPAGGRGGRAVPAGPAGRPELSHGSSGPAVAEAQRLLTRRGLRTAADGRFGSATRSAVVAFQRRRGLTPDGIVGSRTWAALDAAAPDQAVRPAAPVSGVWRPLGAASHTVASGDTWRSIAAARGSTGPALAAANRLDPARRPPVGRSIQVPGTWRCPVVGGRFINDFGFPRPAGRVHQGNDLFAPRGTPVRAPVGGRVERVPNPIGGNAIQLHGNDGTRYYLAHMNSYGASGSVPAGEVIGYVGNSGNAITTPPHLHLEVHPGGGQAINPYPTITLACRR